MITEYSRLPICTSRRAAGRRRRGGRALDEESAPPLDGNVLVGEVFSPNVVQTPDQIVAPEEVPFAQPVTLTLTSGRGPAARDE